MGARDVYALVFMSLMLLFVTILSIAIFIKRNNPYVKCRNPEFLIFQNIGTLLPFSLFCVYISLRPNVSCETTYFGYVTTYSVIGITLLTRCWEYCINYYIAQLKVRFRSFFFRLESVDNYWLYRHRWVGKRKFLCVALAVGVIVCSIPGIVANPGVGTRFDYDEADTCKFNKRNFSASICMILALLVIAISVGMLVRKSRDTYHIKPEMIAIASMWVACVIGDYSMLYAPVHVRYHTPPIIFLLLGMFLTAAISNIPPLCYARKFEARVGVSTENTCEAFVMKLESVNFRNSFHEYLTKQFCQENLQFYEVVKEWKSMSSSDPTWGEKAKTIFSNFINEGAMCQIHIDDDLYLNVKGKIDRGEFAEDMFDEAVEALVLDMHVNSFKLFVNTPVYKRLSI